MKLPICERLRHPHLDPKHLQLREDAATTIEELYLVLDALTKGIGSDLWDRARAILAKAKGQEK